MQKNKRPSHIWLNEETLQLIFEDSISLQNAQILQHLEQLVVERLGGEVMECIAGYHTLTVLLRAANRVDVISLLNEWEQQSFEILQVDRRLLRIPVCYDEEFALDLERMEQATGLGPMDLLAFRLGHAIVGNARQSVAFRFKLCIFRRMY